MPLIPSERMDGITWMLVIRRRHPNARIRSCICESLSILAPQIPSAKHKTILPHLCHLLLNSDERTQTCAFQALLMLSPYLTYNLRILLLAQVAESKNIHAQKLFIYLDHQHSRELDKLHKEKLIAYATGNKDVATVMRKYL